MQFIPTKHGYVALSKVTSIRIGAHEALVSYEEGGELFTTAFSHSNPHAIHDYLGEVVPATPGYEALDLCGCREDCRDIFRTPVIAWRINGDMALPIGVDDIEDSAALRSPDGQVFVPGVAAHDDIDCWRAAIHEERRRQGGVK